MTQKALLQRQIPQGGLKSSNNSFTLLCWFHQVAVLLHPPESLEERGCHFKETEGRARQAPSNWDGKGERAGG